VTNRRHVRTKAGKKHQFLLSSQAEQLRALRYMGAEMSRFANPKQENIMESSIRITTYIRLVAYSLAAGAGIYALILVLFFYFSLVE